MNPEALQWYVILLTSGLLLIGLEIFIPGGVLGVIGALALMGAVALGFSAFPSPYGMLSALVILLASAFVLYAWIRFFPRTRMGKVFTLSNSTRDFKASDPHRELEGLSGTAVTELRPSGIADIDGRRVDVIADGGWISANTPIRVVQARGSIVRVEAIEDATHA